MFRRLGAARVGRLGTVGADGNPHVVPVCFAVLDEVVYTAVDRKPKRSSRLRRVANIEATGRATLLVDEYDDRDWSRLWWVRVDGPARVVSDQVEASRALRELVAKYPQYAETAPLGPVLAVTVESITGWAAAGGVDG